MFSWDEGDGVEGGGGGGGRGGCGEACESDFLLFFHPSLFMLYFSLSLALSLFDVLGTTEGKGGVSTEDD